MWVCLLQVTEWWKKTPSGCLFSSIKMPKRQRRRCLEFSEELCGRISKEKKRGGQEAAHNYFTIPSFKQPWNQQLQPPAGDHGIALPDAAANSICTCWMFRSGSHTKLVTMTMTTHATTTVATASSGWTQWWKPREFCSTRPGLCRADVKEFHDGMSVWCTDVSNLQAKLKKFSPTKKPRSQRWRVWLGLAQPFLGKVKLLLHTKRRKSPVKQKAL